MLLLHHIITLLHIQAYIYLKKQTNKHLSYPAGVPLSSKCLSECEVNIARSSNLFGVAFWPMRRPMWAKRGWGNPRFGFCRGMQFFLFLSNSCRLLHSSRLRNRSTRLQCVISQAECVFYIVCLCATFRRSRLEWLIAQWDSLSWQWLKSLLNNTQVKASGKTDQHSLSQTFVTFACSDLFRSCHLLLRDEGDDVDKSIKMILNAVRIFKAERLVKWIAFVSPAASSWQ